MITIEQLRIFALSFPETTEEPHFEKTSFRVRKKIFATYDCKNQRASIKLSEVDQDLFCSTDKSSIYPVPNRWGKQGWTFVEVQKVKEEVFMDALTTSYCEVASKELAQLVKTNVEQ